MLIRMQSSGAVVRDMMFGVLASMFLQMVSSTTMREFSLMEVMRSQGVIVCLHKVRRRLVVGTRSHGVILTAMRLRRLRFMRLRLPFVMAHCVRAHVTLRRQCMRIRRPCMRLLRLLVMKQAIRASVMLFVFSVCSVCSVLCEVLAERCRRSSVSTSGT